MKYIKNITEELDGVKSIEDWCEVFNLKNYIINNVDNTVDVNGFVDITYKKLENIPIQFGIVTYNFSCGNNHLYSLKGSPKIVNGHYDCRFNNLINSLEGGPLEVGYSYNCEDNRLISLNNICNNIEDILLYCIDNPIYNVYRLFDNYKEYKNSLDYNYLRGDKIIKLRFAEALEEISCNLPKSIKGYEYI